MWDREDIEQTPAGRVFTSYLMQRGIRCTKPRKWIVAVVTDLPAQFLVRDVIDLVEERVGRGTVYRTLMELEESRLLTMDGEHCAKHARW